MIGLEYESVVKYISRKKIIVFIGWSLSLFLASNTFWASVNGTEPVGIDRFIECTINPPNFGVTMYAVMTSAMFGLPILGRCLHTNFKARCTEILQKK